MSMIEFTTTIKKFAQKGEKTGWTYIDILNEQAQQLSPDNKKSFRVKGKINSAVLPTLSLLPMGGGNFILPLNKSLQQKIKLPVGAKVTLQLQFVAQVYKLNEDFVACLNDEPTAAKHFAALPKGHQNYFSKWMDAAKTTETKIKRIAKAIHALSKGWGYAQMIKDKV